MLQHVEKYRSDPVFTGYAKNFKTKYCYWSAISKQVAQLSQGDHTAGWVSYGQKWKMILSAHNIGLSSTTVT